MLGNDGTFATEPGEETLMVIRKHWLVYGKPTLKAFGLLLLLFGFWIAQANYFQQWQGTAIINILTIFSSIFALIILAYLYVHWVNYYFDLTILTNQRMLFVNQKRIFAREVSELNFLKVQDTKVDVSGILQTYMNFGNVLVETAGESPNFSLDHIANPHEVANKIMDQCERLMDRTSNNSNTNNVAPYDGV